MSPSILRIRCPTEYFYLTPLNAILGEIASHLKISKAELLDQIQ